MVPNVRDGTFSQRLAAWAAQSDKGRVVFTVADANYADYMNDARLDTSQTFWTNLLVVALDEAAAVAACAAGCGVVRFGGGNGKEAIYEAKYGTLSILLSLKRDATFREMDVWHLRDPIKGMTEADVVFGVHQDNPYNINAGWVHARSINAWTARLFEDLVRYLKLNPRAFDQQVLNCMVSVSSARDECDAKGVAAQDPILRRWTTPPARVTHATIGPDVLVAHARPYVMASTKAVHVLTTIPLTDARGKTDVARELMLWPGARDYYRVGAGYKYIAVRGGVLSTSSPEHLSLIHISEPTRPY